MIAFASDFRGSTFAPLARFTADTYRLIVALFSRIASVEASWSVRRRWPYERRAFWRVPGPADPSAKAANGIAAAVTPAKTASRRVSDGGAWKARAATATESI